MPGFKISLCASVLVLIFAATVHGQLVRPWIPSNVPGFAGLCQQQPPPRPVSRTVEVNVPVCFAPSTPCMPMKACAPLLCFPPVSSCPPPCPTKPVRVRVDVVVRPGNPKPCVPHRYCCENPPVFEPIFYHAAWMLKSMVAAPLALGDYALGRGAVHQPLPPPIPVACISSQVTPCPNLFRCLRFLDLAVCYRAKLGHSAASLDH